ncbi:non-homologous end joining protein Ku [Streptomyces albospinus]|uniref:Non-homologous end joining protein Ku n=1 Tax=Streptomyces albospinus TaxID=285515 RepID=A0ABQ2VNX4_9ACTN|nr:Ku protein [Streptomyces albospinus]GGV03617.1 non-homologous end joining protein Ku [Streptomyces albospinus]
MRSIWQVTIAFGMVALPADLYAATEEQGPGLHLVHAADGARVRHKRVCEIDGQQLSAHETARGWQMPDGRTVILTDADPDALPPPTKRTVEVLGFIGADDVDPLLYARPYWIGASTPAAQRPYALLVEALSRTGRLGVAMLTLRSRERLAVLRPRNGILVCQTPRWPEEIRDPGDLASPAPTTEHELELAELLISEVTGVEVEDLHDEYAAALDALVGTLAAGGHAAVPPPEPALPEDLMAALEASVQRARQTRNAT